MNERIRELARQAGFETNEANCSFSNYKIDQEYFFAEDFIEDELKKFAELIIKECAKFLDENSGSDQCNNVWYPTPEEMLQHFGVEE